MENKILISNNEYHANEAIGSTVLKAITQKSVIHALENPFVENESSIIGSALHCYYLTRENFDLEYIVSPKFDRRTKAGKADFAEFQEKADGKTVINEEQFELIKGMNETISTHETAKSMLTGGESEFSYFTKDEETGLTLKCRPDHVNKDALIDLKTARDASYKGFQKACGNLSYHVQAAFYLDVYNKANGTNLKEFYFIVVENTAPFAVAVYHLDELAIEHGRMAYVKALKTLAEYKKESTSKEFKRSKYMYGEGITALDLPPWAFTA